MQKNTIFATRKRKMNMKRNSFIGLLLIAVAIGTGIFLLMRSRQQPVTTTDDVQNGDLVFVVRPRDGVKENDNEEGAAIDLTRYDLIHVALLEREGDSLYIVDATIKHGVDRHPIDTFFTDFTRHDGTLLRFLMGRVEGFDGNLAIRRARAFVGRPYDIHFGIGTDSLYCTELVRNAFVTMQGDTLFTQGPIRFADPDGTVSAYWQRLFGSVGLPVPDGKTGTTPRGQYEDPIVTPLGERLKDRGEEWLRRKMKNEK